jgi:hypothetical protein
MEISICRHRLQIIGQNYLELDKVDEPQDACGGGYMEVRFAINLTFNIQEPIESR